MLSPFEKPLGVFSPFSRETTALPVFNPEEGLIQTLGIPIGSFDAPEESVRNSSVVIALDIQNIDTSGMGQMIWEVGGTGQGAYLGFDAPLGTYNGNMIFRCGSGGARWQSNCFYAVYDKDSFIGDVTIVAAIEVTGGQLLGKLYSNGELLTPIETSGAATSPPGDVWTGTGPGAYLTVTAAAPRDESKTPAVFTSASPIRMYAGGQTVNDL